MKNNKNIHITKSDKGWQIKRVGSNRASKKFKTQAEAINKATETACRDKVELLIHNTKGEIRERNSFGNDPFPPKG